ncbi:MAG: YggS family pyridoxal phosphate-dependent enzyme [Ignavibacteriales bacterium]|nr:YggS family pyridoxal phosphate-dependent enzyme [Ignavibacteriales bacterium]
MIADNLRDVRETIAAACRRCKRNPDEVTLVAVSKTFGVERIREAVEAGQLDFGENYVQELLPKREQLPNREMRWHFIGHLQSNKAKFIAPFVHLIHSVDDFDLAKELNKRAANLGRVVHALIEVHTTDESTKFGVLPERTLALVKSVAALPNVRIRGLMTMGPLSGGTETARWSYRMLRELRDEVAAAGIEGAAMEHLSMGMSNDYEVAIEEGATIVRIGTSVFGERS